MEYAVLGHTGLRVSCVGCGGGGIGQVWGPTTEAESVTLLAHDVARAQTLDFLLEGPLRTLSQAAMVFCLMNRDLATIVPGVKNVAEMEELVACVALPPIPPPHLTRLWALYARGFQG
jgi:aryl-alcohol dehydrogenase-like predicted oxidoreductase